MNGLWSGPPGGPRRPIPHLLVILGGRGFVEKQEPYILFLSRLSTESASPIPWPPSDPSSGGFEAPSLPDPTPHFLPNNTFTLFSHTLAHFIL